MRRKLKEKFFNTGKVNLNYAEGPQNGPALLLLHGGSSRWQSFEPLIPDLQDSWHIYALDLRGHGKSGRIHNGYRIQDYVPDIEVSIKDCIKQPAIIFGHSLGGMIAIMVASSNPEVTKAVIIGDSPISIEVLKEHSEKQKEMTILWRELAKTKSTEHVITKLKQMLIPIPNKEELAPAYKVFGEDNPWFTFMAENLSQNDPDMLTAIIDNFDDTYAQYQIDELLPQIECPVLILQGNPDLGGLIRDIDIKRSLNLLPNVQHMKINTVGHALHMQDKETVKDAIIPFMKSL